MEVMTESKYKALKNLLIEKRIKEVYASDLEGILRCSRGKALNVMVQMASRFPNHFSYFLGRGSIPSRLINNDGEATTRPSVILVEGVPSRILKTD